MDIRLLLLAIPWALLGSTLRSQNTWYWQDNAHWNPVRTATALGLPQTELARGIVTGNISGHFDHDVALLLGSEVAFCTAPSIHNHVMRVPPLPEAPQWGTPTGLGVLPRGGSHGRDLLVVASANGLHGWSVDTGTSLLATGNWQSVCVGDLDGYPPDDFVGLSGASNDTICICLRRHGYVDAYSELVLASAIATKVVLAQWGAQSGPLEICVATTATLWIGNPAGAIQQVAFANDGGGQFIRTRVGGQDRLTWLGQVSGQKRLRMFWSGNATDQDGTWIGAPTDLNAADWNNDQVDDLIVARTGGAPWLVFGDPAMLLPPPYPPEPYASTGWLVTTPFSNPQPTNIAWPAAWIGDLNGDRVPDLFAASRWTTGLGVTTSLWPCRRIPSLVERTHLSLDETVSINSDPVTGSTSYLIDMLNVEPLTVPMPTHMELLVYQGDVSSTVLQTNPAPFRRVRVPYLGSAIPQIGWRMPTASAPEAFMGAIRWIHVEGGATTRAWPSTLFVLGIDGAIQPYLNWIGPRIAECNPPAAMMAPNSIGGYSLNRELSLSGGSDTHSLTGDEGGGTGDLPPPPPDPPKPPTPPPSGPPGP